MININNLGLYAFSCCEVNRKKSTRLEVLKIVSFESLTFKVSIFFQPTPFLKHTVDMVGVFSKAEATKINYLPKNSLNDCHKITDFG